MATSSGGLLENLLQDALVNSAVLLRIPCTPPDTPGLSIGVPVLSMNSTTGMSSMNSTTGEEPAAPAALITSSIHSESISAAGSVASSSTEGPPLVFQRTVSASEQSPSSAQLSLFQPTSATSQQSTGHAAVSQSTADPTPSEEQEPSLQPTASGSLKGASSAQLPGLLEVRHELGSVCEAIGAADRASTACSSAQMLAIGTIKGTVHVWEMTEQNQAAKALKLSAARSYRGVDPTAVVSLSLSSSRAKDQMLAVAHESGLLWMLAVSGKHSGSCVVSVQPPELPLTTSPAIGCWVCPGVLFISDTAGRLCWLHTHRRFRLWGIEAGIVSPIGEGDHVVGMAAAPGDALLVALILRDPQKSTQSIQMVSPHEKGKRGAASLTADPVSLPGADAAAAVMVSWCSSPTATGWSLAVGCGSVVAIFGVDCDKRQPRLLHQTSHLSHLRGLWWLSHQGLMIATISGWLQVVHCEVAGYDKCPTSFAELLDDKPSSSTLTQTLAEFVPLPFALVVDPSSTQCMANRSALLLGYHGACVVRALTWDERIEKLVQDGHWQLALNLGSEFWTKENVALAAGCDSPLNLVAMQQLLWRFVEWSLAQEGPGSGINAQQAAAAAIDFCSQLAATTGSMRAVATHELWTRFDQGQGSSYLCALVDAVLERKIWSAPVPLIVAMVNEPSIEAHLKDAAVTMLEKPPSSGCELLQKAVQACAECGLRRAHAFICVEWLDDWLTPLQLLLSASENVCEELLAYLVLVEAQAPVLIVSAVLGAFLADDAAVTALLLYSPKAICQMLTAHLCHEGIPQQQVVQVVSSLATVASVSTSAIAEVDALIVTVASSVPDALSCATVTRATLNLAKQPSNPQVVQQLSWLMQSLPPERIDEQMLIPVLRANGASDALQPAWVRRHDHDVAIESMMNAGFPRRALAYISMVSSDPNCTEQTKQSLLQAVMMQVIAHRHCRLAVLSCVLQVRPLVISSAHWVAWLVCEVFPAANLQLLNQLAEAPDEQFLYVTAMIELQTVSDKASGPMRKATVTRALELAPLYAPAMMVKLLQSFPGDFDLQTALSIAQLHKVTAAEAFLLERSGDDSQCLEIMLTTLEKELHANGTEITQLDPADLEIPQLAQIIEMCARASSRVQLEERFTQVLDHLLVRAPVALRSPLGQLVAIKYVECTSSAQFVTSEHSNTNEIGAFTRAVAAVDLAHRTATRFSESRIAEVQPVIGALIADVKGICETLESATHLTWQSAAAGQDTYYRQLVKPCHQTAPARAQCAAAEEDYCENTDSILRVYWCGHVYHHSCTAFGKVNDRCSKCQPAMAARRACPPNAPFDSRSRANSSAVKQPKLAAAERLKECIRLQRMQDVKKNQLTARVVGRDAVRQSQWTLARRTRQPTALDYQDRIQERDPSRQFAQSNMPVVASVPHAIGAESRCF